MRFIVRGDKNLFEERILKGYDSGNLTHNMMQQGFSNDRIFFQSGKLWSYIYVPDVNFITTVHVQFKFHNHEEKQTKVPIIQDWALDHLKKRDDDMRPNNYAFLALVNQGMDSEDVIKYIYLDSEKYEGYYEQIFFI